MSELGAKIAYVAACLVIPILWGWVVHLIFAWLRRRRGRPPEDDANSIEYQI